MRAARKWGALINDALEHNAQFAALWREHKHDCASGFLQKYPGAGNLKNSAAALLHLLRSCIRSQHSTETDTEPVRAVPVSALQRQVLGARVSLSLYGHANVPGSPMSEALRLALYRSALAQKKELTRKIEAATDEHVKQELAEKKRTEKLCMSLMLLESL